MVSSAIEIDEKISTKPQNNDSAIVENDDEDECDEVSIVSSDSQLECDNGGALVLDDVQDKNPCFQNIEVTNSSDVHFGNKTYYQGPVTIKQILYTNPSQNNNDSDETTQNCDKLPITDSSYDGTVNNSYVISETGNGVVKNADINNINSNNLSNNWTQKNNKGKYHMTPLKYIKVFYVFTYIMYEHTIICINNIS